MDGIVSVPSRGCPWLFTAMVDGAARFNIDIIKEYGRFPIGTAHRRTIMANKNTKKALEQFKMEAASEVGVNLTQGYNGDLTSREASDLGKARWSRRCVPYEARSTSGRAGLLWDIARGWST